MRLHPFNLSSFFFISQIEITQKNITKCGEKKKTKCWYHFCFWVFWYLIHWAIYFLTKKFKMFDNSICSILFFLLLCETFSRFYFYCKSQIPSQSLFILLLWYLHKCYEQQLQPFSQRQSIFSLVFNMHFNFKTWIE